VNRTRAWKRRGTGRATDSVYSRSVDGLEEQKNPQWRIIKPQPGLSTEYGLCKDTSGSEECV
jgi:hypothetical protein